MILIILILALLKRGYISSVQKVPLVFYFYWWVFPPWQFKIQYAKFKIKPTLAFSDFKMVNPVLTLPVKELTKRRHFGARAYELSACFLMRQAVCFAHLLNA